MQYISRFSCHIFFFWKKSYFTLVDQPKTRPAGHTMAASQMPTFNTHRNILTTWELLLRADTL
jgi:hypothetical protein